MESLKNYFLEIKKLFLKDNDYFQRKLDDYKSISSLIFFICAFLGPSLWIWDLATDSIGAKSTIFLRLLFFFIFIPPGLAFIYTFKIKLLFWLSIIFIMIAEVVFVIILNRLDSGMTYGIAGFMYFLFFGILIFQGFSLFYNFLFIFIIVVFPHFLAWFDIAHGFEHYHYSTLIYPAAFATMLVQIGSSINYNYRKEYEEKLNLISNTDYLTGIHNRKKINFVLSLYYSKYKRNSLPFSVMIFDIDFFKRVNDTYGHNIGDKILIEFTQVLKNSIRETDILGRWGGEEFILVVESSDENKIFLFAEKIRKIIENHNFYNNIKITMSIGIALLKESDSIENLISRADKALYISKNNSRNKTTLL